MSASSIKRLAAFSASLLLSAGCASPSLAAHRGNSVSTAAAGGAPATQLVCAACDAVPTSWVTGTTYYVKPTGNDSSAGTSLGAAFQTAGKALSVWVAGDTIRLESGSYGDVTITNQHFATFARMVADAGQTPIFSSITISGGQHMYFQGLEMKSHANGNAAQISIAGNVTDGASSNVVLDHMLFESDDDATVAGWDAATWTSTARRYAILIDGQDVSSTYAKKISLTNSTIKNIRGGIGLTADDLLVADTSIDNFADDALDFAGNRIKVLRSGCTNGIAIGDGNHNDCMQGQIGHGAPTDGSDDNGSGPVTVYDSVIFDGVWFYDRTHTAASMPLFTTADYATQGIGNFDEDWTNCKIINSILVGSATALINVAGWHGGLIANNIVLNTSLNTGSSGADYSGGINIKRWSHEGTQGDHVTVRNNYTGTLSDEFYMPTNIYDHNYTGIGIVWNVGGSGSFNHPPNYGTYTDYSGSATNFLTATPPSSFFVTVDFVNGNYDLHEKVGSPGIRAGGPGAPNKTDGTVRGSADDIGPY